MEFHIRSARLTDVDSAMRLLLRGDEDPGEQRGDADRLRSLLFLPAATVIVAEAERRLVGVGVLSIRPTVRQASFVGVIDELGLEGGPGRATRAAAASATGRSEVGSAILEHLISSARNKGCARVEVTDPLAAAETALLKGAGFARRGALLSRAIG
ncbi:MAG TPA: GNAT family N-acetyltransferase [Candidatus Limnocylindria bacterium]